MGVKTKTHPSSTIVLCTSSMTPILCFLPFPPSTTISPHIYPRDIKSLLFSYYLQKRGQSWFCLLFNLFCSSHSYSHPQNSFSLCPCLWEHQIPLFSSYSEGQSYEKTKQVWKSILFHLAILYSLFHLFPEQPKNVFYASDSSLSPFHLCVFPLKWGGLSLIPYKQQ